MILCMKYIPNKPHSCRKSLFCRETQWNNKFFLVIRYAVERWAPAVQIKVSLSWQTLENFTLTVTLCVNQTQPAHIMKQMHVSLKEPHQNKMSFQYGTLRKRKCSTGTITWPSATTVRHTEQLHIWQHKDVININWMIFFYWIWNLNH